MSEWEASPTPDWVDDAITAWDNDPEAWKEPLAAAPTQRSLRDQFEDLYVDRSVLEFFRAPLSEATGEFFDLVKARWVQMARDRDPQMPRTADADEFKTLSLDERIRATDRLDRLMHSVFDYLASQGRTAVPGWTEWYTIVPENMWEKADRLRP